jgi:hypothetical protein
MARNGTPQFRKTLLTMVTSAFVLVAGLFWNETIKSLVTALGLSPTGSFVAQLVAALVVTAVAVVAVFLLQRLLGK